MEKSKKQENLSDDDSIGTCACDNNNVSEKERADFDTVCNFTDKFVSSQKDMPDEMADFVVNISGRCHNVKFGTLFVSNILENF